MSLMLDRLNHCSYTCTFFRNFIYIFFNLVHVYFHSAFVDTYLYAALFNTATCFCQQYYYSYIASVIVITANNIWRFKMESIVSHDF